MTEFKIPPVLYHGTRVVFDDFEPFSQFASKKTAMCYLEKPVHKSSSSIKVDHTSLCEYLSQSVIASFSALKETKTDKEPKILIPVQLTMHRPFHLKHSGFHFTDMLEGIVYHLLEDSKAPVSPNKATPQGDFIFKNPLEISHEDVCKELKMDTLFSVTEDEERNRAHLSKQRFIQFLEKNGYDGIVYDYHDYHGNDEPAYAIFRKEQVLRLDKPNPRQGQFIPPQNKELEKIATRYIRSHKERDLSITEYLARADSYSR